VSSNCAVFSLVNFILSDLKSVRHRERGHAAAQLVEAPCRTSEGRGFDSRWGHFSLK